MVTPSLNFKSLKFKNSMWRLLMCEILVLKLIPVTSLVTKRIFSEGLVRTDLT